MKTLRNILIIMLIIAIAAFGFLLYHKYQNPDYIIRTDTIKTKTTKFNITPVAVIPSKPKPQEPVLIYKDSLRVDTVTIYDTVEIYNDYFNIYFYLDTLFNDSTGLCIVKDSISQNKIKSRQVVRESIINTYYAQPKGLYLGGGLNSIGSIDIGASYLNNKNMFTIKGGYNANLKGGFVGFDYKHKIGFNR